MSDTAVSDTDFVRAFHVTSSRNRESIAAYGLDWTRMGAACGIAGSPEPELEGCFVCVDKGDVDFFTRINNTGGPVDVWSVDGVDRRELREIDGFHYVERRIPPDRLTLLRRDVVSEPEPENPGEEPLVVHAWFAPKEPDAGNA